MTERPKFTEIKRFTACIYDTPPKVWMNWTYEGEAGKEPNITDGDYRILKYLVKNCSFQYRENHFGYECSIKGLAKQLDKDRTSVKRGLSRLMKSGAVKIWPSEGKRSFFQVKHFEETLQTMADFQTLLESFGIRYRGYF